MWGCVSHPRPPATVSSVNDALPYAVNNLQKHMQEPHATNTIQTLTGIITSIYIQTLFLNYLSSN